MNSINLTNSPNAFSRRSQPAPSQSHSRWQFPELLKLKLPPDANLFSTTGRKILEESRVTLFTGNTLLSKDRIEDPVLRDLANAAKKTLQAMEGILSTNYLSRNFILRNNSSMEIMKELYTLQGKLGELDREIPTQFENIEELLIAAEKIKRLGIANCKQLSIVAFADLFKTCNVSLQNVEGGDHMYLILSSQDGKKSVLFDPWSRMISPADLRPYVPIGITIIQHPKPPETFLSSPILVPVDSKQIVRTVFSYPPRSRL